MGIKTLLFAALTGAAAGYLLDPESGRRRRALLRDQIDSLTHTARNEFEEMTEQASDRAKGAVQEAEKHLSDDEIADRTLIERVRAQLGRHVSSPGAIDVEAKSGKITLRGNILADEVQDFVKAVKGIPGVKNVDNQMMAHEDAGHIPDLQGGRDRPEQR